VEEATAPEVTYPATQHRVIEALDVDGASRQGRPGIHQRGATDTHHHASREEFDLAHPALSADCATRASSGRRRFGARSTIQ
jgi:hypothetical protein